MALEMRPICERCETKFSDYSDAYICAFECTFCPERINER
ncbi:MAG: DUF1272 domain-containing protein [Candidatus Marinimicrobia bacterium]|nr:DUF1272 domain-containing protein [Candidatus Neomarinimicrobiota bacterium]